MPDLNDEIVELQRLAMLGTSSAMVAHELNNLMTPMLARAQDALSRDDVPAMRKALERVVTGVQRATAMSSHLLGVARTTAPQRSGSAAPRAERQACSVAQAVRDALLTIARPFDKDGMAFEIAVADDVHVRADPVLLHQVFVNLLLNARKAMEGVRSSVTVAAAREGEFVVVDVRDSGRGFAAGDIERRINPFLTAAPGVPNDWGAVGLGLAVCRRIAHEHQASIRAVGNDGPGCTIRLRWPAA